MSFIKSNFDTYYQPEQPKKVKIPTSFEDFQSFSYLERLQLKRERPKLFDCYTKKINKKWPWER